MNFQYEENSIFGLHSTILKRKTTINLRLHISDNLHDIMLQNGCTKPTSKLMKVFFDQTLGSAVVPGTVVSGGDPLRVQLPVIGCCDKPIISDRKREFS